MFYTIINNVGEVIEDSLYWDEADRISDEIFEETGEECEIIDMSEVGRDQHFGDIYDGRKCDG